MTVERNETPAERQDRLWTDLLQELRVMQTGAQLTAGFLLTLPFHDRFTELDGVQRGLYLILVTLALLTTALVMSAVAVHRRLTGLHVKHRVVAAGRTLLGGVQVTLGLLVVGLAVFLFDMVVSRGFAIAAGVVFGTVVLALLVVLPRRLLPSEPAPEDDSEGG